MKVLLLATLLVTTAACNEKKAEEAKIEKVTISDFSCADMALCEDLRISEEMCRGTKEPANCAKFVATFEKLAVTSDCQRKFDTKPVPSIWVCDEGSEEGSPKIFERSADTLSKIDLPAAKKFYGSEAFRSTLDGGVAETHMQKSKEVGSTIR